MTFDEWLEEVVRKQRKVTREDLLSLTKVAALKGWNAAIEAMTSELESCTSDPVHPRYYDRWDAHGLLEELIHVLSADLALSTSTSDDDAESMEKP